MRKSPLPQQSVSEAPFITAGAILVDPRDFNLAGMRAHQSNRMRRAGQSCARSQHMHPGTPGGELEVGGLMKERQRGKSANEKKNVRAQAEQRDWMLHSTPLNSEGGTKKQERLRGL